MKSVTESGDGLKSVEAEVEVVLVGRHEDDDGHVEDGEADQRDEPSNEELVDADAVEDTLGTKLS